MNYALCIKNKCRITTGVLSGFATPFFGEFLEKIWFCYKKYYVERKICVNFARLLVK